MADVDDIQFDLNANSDQSVDTIENCPSPPPPFHRKVTEPDIIVEPPITFIDRERTTPVKNIVPFDIIFFNDAKTYLFETTSSATTTMNESVNKSSRNVFQRFLNFFRFSILSQQDIEFHRQCEQLLQLTKYPCNMTDRIHIRILFTIYRRLTHSKEIFYSTLGPHWEEIGFQSTNPETDFRSTAKTIYLLSLDQVQEFPFCCIGINLANILIKYLRQTNTSRAHLRKLLNENTAIDIVGKLFIALYLNFYLKWRDNGYTITNTQQVLIELEKILNSQPRILLQEFDDYFHKRQEHRAQQYELRQTQDNLI